MINALYTMWISGVVAIGITIIYVAINLNN